MAGGMRRCALVLTMTISVITLGSLVSPVAMRQSAAAEGSNGLSGIVISGTLPGLVAAPAGPTNGPINSANLKFFTGTTARADLAQLLADGTVHGYLRVWAPRPPNGDGVGIVALRFQDRSEVGAFLAGLIAGERQVGGVKFPVPDLPGASGYSSTTSTPGAPTPQYTVAFAKGNTAFEVEVIDKTGTLTTADAATVALEQAANAPGPPRLPSPAVTTSWARRTGEVVGYVVLGLLVAGLVLFGIRRARRNRRRRTRHAAPFAARFPAVAPAAHGAPPEPSSHRVVPEPGEVGWHGDSDHISEQAYWDGRRWTARRRWSGTAWVEVRLPPNRD